MKNAYVNKRRIAPPGYVAVTKLLAKNLYEQNIEITMAGNNVNNFHIFDGWRLGYTFNKKVIEERFCGVKACQSFDRICNDFLFYLDRELGRYLVFYVKKKEK